MDEQDQAYYRRGVRALRRRQLQHRILPHLHAWPAEVDPDPTVSWQRCLSCGLTRAKPHVESACPYCSPAHLARSIERFGTEDGDVLVMEPRQPLVPGHLLVVPERHVAGGDHVAVALLAVATQVAGQYVAADVLTDEVEEELSPTATPHVHAHVVPHAAVRDDLHWSPVVA